MEFSVPRPSPPNTYSYVREENLGSTRKLVEIYLLFTCISNLILAIHTQIMNGRTQGTFLRQQRIVPPAHAQRVFEKKIVPVDTALIFPAGELVLLCLLLGEQNPSAYA